MSHLNAYHYSAGNFSRREIQEMLLIESPSELEALAAAATDAMNQAVGNAVYYRGLLEFSNICRRDCLYCGIRRSSQEVERFRVESRRVVEEALWAAVNGYGSVTLQSGENHSLDFLNYTESLIRQIKSETRSENLPSGLGITLCIGEQSEDTYRRMYDAGAHRYLLRIETSNPRLYEAIHPDGDSLASRIACLAALERCGYQVGSGVMIGLPGQTVDDLVGDLEFLRDGPVDMVGMGPYIPHAATPLAKLHDDSIWPVSRRLAMTLKMTAVLRLIKPDANIAATTALQTLHPFGRERGLHYGANVLMPLITPGEVRHQYQLYDGKPCLDDSSDDCRSCLLRRVESQKRPVAFNQWGDPRHYTRRKGTAHVSQ